jgi:hypothetical protein
MLVKLSQFGAATSEQEVSSQSLSARELCRLHMDKNSQGTSCGHVYMGAGCKSCLKCKRATRLQSCSTEKLMLIDTKCEFSGRQFDGLADSRCGVITIITINDDVT